MDPDPNESLEQIGSLPEPDLEKIVNEITQANADASWYVGRVSQSKSWWWCEWPGMSPDGRRWQKLTHIPSFPWDGCSDSRVRTVDTLVNEHVMLCLAAFWGAKVQAKSIRQFVSARQVSLDTKMLQWCVYNQLKRELLTELPLAFGWKHAFGLAFLAIEWEQQRQIVDIPISLAMLQEVTTTLGMPDITSKVMNPDRMFDKDLVTVLQAISPVLPTSDAKRIISELRNTGQSSIPTANLRINKPKWTAMRPYVDIWFPSETSNFQHARWTARRELINESELTDRIVTDAYDEEFVDEALKQKGKFSWLTPLNSIEQYTVGSDRDLVELFHFRARVLDNGVPTMYKTILNTHVASEGLYAVHRRDEYDHQEYPFVALRRNYKSRPLMHSIGISEEAYTDEMDIKRQQDGLNDRTDIIHQPPMITPPNRAYSIANQYGPRSVMTALRPDAVVFPPLPPMDQTPVLVMQFVMQRLNRRYPTQNGEGVDPTLVSLYRQFLGTDILSEVELALEQTLQLGDQYWTDAEYMAVTGQPKPQYSRIEIQGKYSVTATVDMTLVDTEVAEKKLGMLAQIMPFKDAGGPVFNAAANIVDPDLADMLEQTQMSPTALKQETDDEYNAISQILSGIEAQKPLMANNQLRLSTIQQIMSDPGTMQRFQQDPIAQKRLQNRITFFQNQIQQFNVNPVIGRTLATNTLNPKALPVTTNAQAGA